MTSDGTADAVVETGTSVQTAFVDRWTLRYERVYPHPIDRVFRAVSEAEHLNEWMLVGLHQVEGREGGAFQFTLGPNVHAGVVSRVDAPHVIEYAFTEGTPSKIRFELTAVGDGDRTRMVMFHHWGPLPGGDRPGFQPDSMTGWAMLLDRALVAHLDGVQPVPDPNPPGREDVMRESARMLAEDLPLPPAHSALATFDGRYAMRHVRTFPHPVERVWDAVTDPKHLNDWMLPHITVEPRVGGRATFTWGGPPDSPVEHTILEWDPPRVVDYGGLRFELVDLGDQGTELTFLHSFPPEFRHPEHTGRPDDPGFDLPGGDDTPWRPGFVAGFHLMLDGLDDYLSWRPREVEHWINGVHPNVLGVYNPTWVWLCQVYRDHIRATIPPAW